MPFQYKKILVIGATSGIGWGMAERFVQEGSSVVIVGRRKENLDKFAAQHGQREGSVSSVVFDVTNLAGIPQFAADITAQHPDLDCIYINSGIQRGLSWLEPEKVDLDQMGSEFLINYTSYMHLTKAFLPFLTAQAPKDVALIYTSSGLALIPATNCPNYCATKAALHHMILAMRMQFYDAKSNVKVIEVLPPLVQTELHDPKHQPQFEGKDPGGMPLDEFVEETYAALSSGKEEIPVGTSKDAFGYNSWEQDRQKNMWEMYETRKKAGM